MSALMQSLEAAKVILYQNMRGASSAAKMAACVNDAHHIFPKAAEFARMFRNNELNINGVLLKIDGYLHRYGMHGKPGGGAYNDIWRSFKNKHSQIKDRPYFVLGFGFGLLERILPALLE